jgi:hypothetical protein
MKLESEKGHLAQALSTNSKVVEKWQETDVYKKKLEEEIR